MLGFARSFALGIWVGGMLTFAFIFAPTAFHHLGATPAFAATIAATLSSLTYFGFGCAVIAVVISFVLGIRTMKNLTVTLGALIATASGIVELAFIIPRMQQTPLQTPAYEALHHLSSGIYSIALITAATAFAVAAWDSHRERRVG